VLPWFALHVRSCSERSVSDKLSRLDIDNFYPFIPIKASAGKRESEQRLMPGYVFARFSLENKTGVVAIPEVAQILGFGKHAVEIPAFEIEAVRKIVSLPLIAKPSAYMAVGDRVYVRRGPLTGLEGFVMRVKNATHVVVSVHMLARSISAEVDAGDLEVIPQGQAA
jgi:transcriptional antiterminator NusG